MKPEYFYFVALLLGLVDEAQSEGRDLLGWAVIVVCLGLLWGVIKL